MTKPDEDTLAALNRIEHLLMIIAHNTNRSGQPVPIAQGGIDRRGGFCVHGISLANDCFQCQQENIKP
jgi:hypothetical protein